MNYIAMYVNYENIPQMEFDCITHNISMALDNPTTCEVILVTNMRYQYVILDERVHIIDADDYAKLVSEFIKINERENSDAILAGIKPNHYADFLAYYASKVAQHFLGDDEAQVLKLDTDFYITSKFALRNVFECDRDTFIGVDEGFIYKYVNGDSNCLPNYFYNAHAVYTTGDSEIVPMQEFVKYLRMSILQGHYTATGPRILNDLYKYPDANVHLSGLTPWTLDPSTLYLNGRRTSMELPVRSAALGVHLQSSVLKSIGMKWGSIHYKKHCPDIIQLSFKGV